MNYPHPHIICTVTNDLTYDQRMHRICTTLSLAGYRVTLVGREMPGSLPLEQQPFRQIRLPLNYQHGKAFYLEYNLKLYKWLKNEATLLAQEKLAICAIDLDTIIPCYLISKRFDLPRLYDAHELFTELTEVKRRPVISAIWRKIEQMYVPMYSFGYTVNQFIKEEFYRRYKVKYGIIRNMPFRSTEIESQLESTQFDLPDCFFLYQGAVNEGRAFDQLVPAMKYVPIPLVVIGSGNYLDQLKVLINTHGLNDRIILLGYLKPSLLRLITPRAFAGITFFNNSGLNQYYSLANRFFDYVQAGVPQLCSSYPEYQTLNDEFEVALLVPEMSPEAIAASMNKMLEDSVLYNKLRNNCTRAAYEWCWENEGAKLLEIWQKVLPRS